MEQRRAAALSDDRGSEVEVWVMEAEAEWEELDGRIAAQLPRLQADVEALAAADDAADSDGEGKDEEVRGDEQRQLIRLLHRLRSATTNITAEALPHDAALTGCPRTERRS